MKLDLDAQHIILFYFFKLSFWKGKAVVLNVVFCTSSASIVSHHSYYKGPDRYSQCSCYSILNWNLILLKLYGAFQTTWISCAMKIAHRKNKNQGFGTYTCKLHCYQSNYAWWPSILLKKTTCDNFDLQWASLKPTISAPSCVLTTAHLCQIIHSANHIGIPVFPGLFLK